MIQSDCGLVLWPICLISSATSAGLLSEHAPLQQRQKINTHTCKKTHKNFFLKKGGITAAKDFLLLRSGRRDNKQQSWLYERKPKTGSSFYVLTCRESYRSAVKYSGPISPTPLKLKLSDRTRYANGILQTQRRKAASLRVNEFIIILTSSAHWWKTSRVIADGGKPSTVPRELGCGNNTGSDRLKMKIILPHLPWTKSM